MPAGGIIIKCDTRSARLAFASIKGSCAAQANIVGCARSAYRKPKGRCDCPLQAKVPGHAPGTTRMVTVHGTLGEARAERRRLMAAGRPPEPTHDLEPGTLDRFAAAYLRARPC